MTDVRGLLVALALLSKPFLHFSCGVGALQFLSVEHLLFERLDVLAGFDERSSDLAVTTTVARGDQIGHATRFKKDLRVVT